MRGNVYSLELLPDELIEKILCFLDDSKSFASLSSICRRFHLIAYEMIYSHNWIKFRPNTYDSSLENNLYSIDGERNRCNCNCVGETFPLASSTNLKETKNCFYSRYFCFLNSKYLHFSTFKIKKADIIPIDCFKSFTDSYSLNKCLVEQNLKVLVELEIYECRISIKWLNQLLINMKHIRYLSMKSLQLELIQDQDDFNSSSHPLLSLIKLSVKDSIPIQVFNYLAEIVTTKYLDISCLTIKAYNDVFRLAYPLRIGIPLQIQRELSVLLVRPFLSKNKDIIERLIMNRTNIDAGGLLKILQDNELQNLIVEAKFCENLIDDDKLRLRNLLSDQEWNRLIL